MNPVDAAKVLEIMDTDLSESQIGPYVISANVFVTSALAKAKLSAETLEQIEIWIAAHMIAVTRERVAKSEEAGSAKIVYAGDFAKGLESTQYGQMAVMLDTTGTLQALIKNKKAWLRAIKTTS